MPPDGGEDLNVIVRDGKKKGGTECCADRTASTGGYAAAKKKKENSAAVFDEGAHFLDYFLAHDISAIRLRIR